MKIPHSSPPVEASHYIALGIGLLGSTVIHLSQGLLKLAIERRQRGQHGTANRWLYATGLVLNFSAPFWVVIANRFGPTVLYTSMYATGLLGLILFSCWKLDRPIRKLEIFGALCLIGGSVLLVIGFRSGGMAEMSQASPAWLIGTALLVAALTWPAVRFAARIRQLPLGLVMGGIGGAFLALDSLLKGVAQADGGVSGFLPVTAPGWALFLLSFLGAAAALGMTQWAHARHQPPTATIAAYDAAYVTLPVLLLPWAQGNLGGVDPLCLLGLAVLVSGLYLIGKANNEATTAHPED